MSRRRSSIAANPVLIGAVTVLVTVTAVFLAYNANNGLPFVPTTQLRFQASNGANLLPGGEVREGGARIGVVDELRPVRLPDGTTGAEVSMRLDAEATEAGGIPVDTTLDLRPRSPLGLKYVELTRGTSPQTFADGDVIPQRQVRFPVELDEFYGMFEEDVREAVQGNLEGFGNTFAQRGASLNAAIGDLPRFLRVLEPVASTLAEPDTELQRFFVELGDAARIIAPVADRYANAFSAGADVFEAWSSDVESLRAAYRTSPPALEAGLRSFPVQRPALAALRDLSAQIERTTRVMPRALPAATSALNTGTPVLGRTPEVNEELQATLASLRDLAASPGTGTAFRGLQRTGSIANPLFRFLGPYVTVCNYFNYAFTHLGEHVTEPDPTGTAQRTLLNQFPRPVDPRAPSMGSIGAKRPANGEPVVSGVPMNYHASAYGAAVTHEGKADCESGQRGYMRRLTTSPDESLEIANLPRTPGVQGPTYSGRDEVPEGQTWSRNPELGPTFPEELDLP